jgi:hypothetical protein
MSEPEIARRCPSCGAFISARGLFCRQCGKPLAEQKLPDLTRGPDDWAAEVTDPGTPELPAGHSEAVLVNDVERQEQSGLESATAPPGTAPAASRNPVGPAKSSMHRARTTVDRARVARDVIEEDVLQGVGKLREISSVVLDEAAYDPSLRFVLVAAVLFVLFLIILILSELIT